MVQKIWREKKINCCITNNEDDKQYLIIMSKFYLESINHYGTIN